jgi:hypothetical protein
VAPFDAEQARQVITEMIDHLSNFDPSAGDCLETNRAVLRALWAGEPFAKFEQQVDSFAFPDALAALQQVTKKRGLFPA